MKQSPSHKLKDDSSALRVLAERGSCSRTESRKGWLIMQALRALRCLGVMLAVPVIVIGLLVIYREVCPYQWHMPTKAISLAFGFSTNTGVEDMIIVLRSKYHVEDKSISVDIIRKDVAFFHEEPVLRRIVVEDFFPPELLAKRKLECLFLQNRLMEIWIRPALSKEESEAVWGDSYGKSLTLGGNGLKDGDEDELLLRKDGCGLIWGVYSKLLRREYVDWMWHRGD